MTQETGEDHGARLNLMQMAEFSRDGPVKKDLMRAGQTDLVLVCFESGQEILPHREPYAVQFLVLSGEGTIVSGDGEYQVEAGHLVAVAANGMRGIRCRTRMTILGIRHVEGADPACRQ
ncbi:cupin domain-containing protein [Methanoculleus sp.]|uniref:cupin domain-containing protein n=1 Tax=Methanoculleus sp. TaxID=90427 RepID=UPI001BD62D31|nr:cupin domain-containing protein [Methanoculleus sp.]